MQTSQAHAQAAQGNNIGWFLVAAVAAGAILQATFSNPIVQSGIYQGLLMAGSLLTVATPYILAGAAAGFALWTIGAMLVNSINQSIDASTNMFLPKKATWRSKKTGEILDQETLTYSNPTP